MNDDQALGLRYALAIVRGRRILNRPSAYLAALDEIEIFLEAALDRVKRGEPMQSLAHVESKDLASTHDRVGANAEQPQPQPPNQ